MARDIYNLDQSWGYQLMSFKREKINGGVEGLLKRVKTPGTVDVGIIDAGKHADSDLTVATIGFAHEFGTATIPERSFIRATTKEKRKEIVKLQTKLLKKIQSGEISTEKALGLLGAFVAGLISKKIVDIKAPPNAPETIKRKGSSNPLVDTGQLKNSITWEVNS